MTAVRWRCGWMFPLSDWAWLAGGYWIIHRLLLVNWFEHSGGCWVICKSVSIQHVFGKRRPLCNETLDVAFQRYSTQYYAFSGTVRIVSFICYTGINMRCVRLLYGEKINTITKPFWGDRHFWWHPTIHSWRSYRWNSKTEESKSYTKKLYSQW